MLRAGRYSGCEGFACWPASLTVWSFRYTLNLYEQPAHVAP